MSEIKEGLDYYFDNLGRMVFTEHYHLSRGYCCGNGCLNCPYDYVNVPEPGQSILLKKKAERKKRDEQ